MDNTENPQPTRNPDGSVSLNDKYDTIARIDERGHIILSATFDLSKDIGEVEDD